MLRWTVNAQVLSARFGRRDASFKLRPLEEQRMTSLWGDPILVPRRKCCLCQVLLETMIVSLSLHSCLLVLGFWALL